MVDKGGPGVPPGGFMGSGRVQRLPTGISGGGGTPVGETAPTVRPTALVRSYSIESVASGASKRGREDEEPLEKRSRHGGASTAGLVSRAMDLLDSDRNKMSKLATATVSDTLLGLERLVAGLEARVAYLEGRVDERLLVKAFLDDREVGLPSVVRESVKQVVSMRGEVGRMLRPSESVKVRGVVKEVPTTVAPVVFVRPVEGKREASAIKQDLLAAMNPGKEGLGIRNVRQARDSR